MLVQIEDAEWEIEGSTLVMFDMTPRFFDDEDDCSSSSPLIIEREVPWGGEMTQAVNSLGMFLSSMAGSTGWDEMSDAYEERLSGGHSDWA
jgi:hypothetical protein